MTPKMRLLTKAVHKGCGQKDAILDLLKWQFNDEDILLAHHSDGKPYLPTYPGIEISISHCQTDVAVLVGTARRLGVDVENKYGQADRLKERFCTPDELELSKEIGLHPIWFWCAKEACFKAFSDKINTLYRQIRVTGLSPTGDLIAEIESYGLLELKRHVLISRAALVSVSTPPFV